jgi:NYN domain
VILDSDKQEHRVSIYIDGFNLYYGALAENPEHKWLCPKALATSFLPKEIGIKIIHSYFFTAACKAKPWESPQEKNFAGKNSRQTKYLDAIKIHSKMEVILGKLVSRKISAYTYSPDNKKNQKIDVWKFEEKCSDVNLASYLVRDSCLNLFDICVVISNDADLTTAFKICKEQRKKILIVNPQLKSRQVNEFHSLTEMKNCKISLEQLKSSQLPPIIKRNDGKKNIEKPKEWS